MRLRAQSHLAVRRSRACASAMSRSWFVYLIECRGGSIYTGIAVDVERRFAQHVAGKGARYTRSHPPLRLLASFAFPDRSSASRGEYAIKQLAPARKRELCAGATLPSPIAALARSDADP